MNFGQLIFHKSDVPAPTPEAKENIPMASVPVTVTPNLPGGGPPPPVGEVLAPSTATSAATAHPHNGFVSFLQHFGADAKKVLSWIGSPKGKATIVAGEKLGEVVADAIDPALIGLNPIVDEWTKEIFKAQAIGSAAIGADPNATNLQKSAAVIGSMVPQVIAYCQANKLAIPNGEQMQTANDALVSFLNALGGPASAQPAA